MKKYILLFVAVLVLTLGSVGYAGETMLDSLRVVPTSDDTYGLRHDYPDGTRVWSITRAGVVWGSFTRSMPLPLTGFMVRMSSSTASPLMSTVSAQGPTIGIASEVPYIQWVDGAVSPVQMTFRIPDNYKSGGSFKLMATETDSTTPNQVDFDVYVNKSGVTSDSSATGQTPVALTEATATPSLVTLSPATDFASLAAGDWITLRLWRDDTAGGSSGSLRVHDVTFIYTATQ